jgi:hypothetical protein
MLVQRYRSRIAFGRYVFLISVRAPARLRFFVAFLSLPKSKFRQLPSKYFHLTQQTSYQRRYAGCNWIGCIEFQVFWGSQSGLFETWKHWLERILHIENCVNGKLGKLRELTSEIGAFFLILRFVFIIVYWLHTLYIRIIKANRMHISQLYFGKELCVSDRLTVHHQES